MPYTLPDAIEKVRKSAAVLNQITNKAQLTVAEVEEFLDRECSAGVHACVQFSEESEGDAVRTWWLEYRRVGQRFRIAVVSSLDVDPESENVRPWSDCPRDLKLESLQKLPKLITEIARRLDDTITKAEKSTKVAIDVLKALKKREGQQ